MTPGTQRFSVLALLYLVTNARIGSGNKRRRVQRVMTRPEREAVTAILERLPATVAEWSGGLAALEPMHIVEVRRQLTSLSSSGEGRWWAGPRDCRDELVELADEPRYDSIVVLWPSAPDVPLCGWGCTVEPSQATFGAGFSSIATDHWSTLATDPDPEQGYVHEWLHQVEAIYRGFGLDEEVLPPLHYAAAFTSTRPIGEPPFGRSYAEYHEGTAAWNARSNPISADPGPDASASAVASDGHDLPAARTWAPWYRDWMTGCLRRLAPTEGTGDAKIPIGLTPERWALRSR